MQTYSCDTLPSTSVVTLWTFALKVRFVFLCEWLTLFPATLPLPQTEHTLLISDLLTCVSRIFIINIPRFGLICNQNRRVFGKKIKKISENPCNIIINRLKYKGMVHILNCFGVYRECSYI